MPSDRARFRKTYAVNRVPVVQVQPAFAIVNGHVVRTNAYDRNRFRKNLLTIPRDLTSKFLGADRMPVEEEVPVDPPEPTPDPDLTTPDPANNLAYFVPSGPFWQDVARTMPATAGQNYKVWDDASGNGQHRVWQSGPVATVLADGGGFEPAGCVMTCLAASTGTSWSFYIWSDAPSPFGLNFLVGNLGGTGIQIAPVHTAGLTYFATAASNYQTIVDEPSEKLRGMAMTGASASAFCGGDQVALTLNAITVSGFTTNADATYQSDHTIRFIVLRNVADALDVTNAYRRHVSRLLYPINPDDDVIKVAIVWHFEGQVAPGVGTALNNIMLQQRARTPFAKYALAFSPVYETEGGSHAAIAAGFAPLVHAGLDAVWMHIHWYFSVAIAAGVTPADHPTSSSPTAPDGSGYGVLSTAYNLANSTTIFNAMKAIIASYGYGTPTGFVAGNWLTNAVVRQALAASGFTHDASALPPSLAAILPAYLQGLIGTEWSSLTETSQPYDIVTGSGTLRQIVTNCGMASYDDASDMAARLAAIPAGGAGVISCHFEDSPGMIALADALVEFEAHCAANGKRIVHVLPDEL